VSLLRVGLLSNRLLVGGIVFELAIAAAAVYLPPLQAVLGTRPLTGAELALLATFPPVVWGVDELYRWRRRASIAAAGGHETLTLSTPRTLREDEGRSDGHPGAPVTSLDPVAADEQHHRTRRDVRSA
jgi:hypothetical protein